MVFIVILFFCVFSLLSRGTNDKMYAMGTFGTYSQQIDCVVNISEYHYEISCDGIHDNCSVVDIPPDEDPPRVCLYISLKFL